MEFGALIKFYRTQRGITQAELAKGICSVPHLSKIENNSKEANEETISLLLERLEISLEEIEEKEDQIKILLREFAEKINFYLKDKIDETFQQLKEIEHIIPFSKYIYVWELYKFRYLIFKGLVVEAESQRDLLYKQKKNFSQHEDYLFRYYNAVFLMWKGQYKNADDILDALHAENGNETTDGEFLYHRALIKSSLEQSGHAIHFGKMALQIFMNQHNFYRILHTLMLLGINYTHSNIYEEAQGCFQHLIRNAELLKEERMLPQIYHNMGYLQNKMKNVKGALYYYEKSLDLQPNFNQHYLVTLYSIGELNYHLQSVEKARECFQEVHSLAKDLGVKKYRLLADFYLFLLVSPSKGFKYLETKVIPYFEEANEHIDDLTSFYKMLADYYQGKGMIMEAVNYLNKIT
ncbi:transcriptional regulator with XRE-family HTH domain [Bacillus sp. SLBN-46]|uniref:helix-turn-helix domain-containing protein n=1 Tax=Bacillus sp. SLBN-46 TaxID=3042283 RepID=UPI0028607BD3|nr:helix-turn-helix domain-containing protein [Bacillus sp. SLBN-46]MDR6121855.1 transcriptional regulator with XRE-family HTH domain [Bacillus sp. SLBN-46]